MRNIKQLVMLLTGFVCMVIAISCGQSSKQTQAFVNTEKQEVGFVKDTKKKIEIEQQSQSYEEQIKSNLEPIKEVSVNKKQSGHLANYMITKSLEKKFDNWSFGGTEIVLVTQPYNYKSKQKLVVGKFNANGSFTIQSNLPKVNTDREIKYFFNCLAMTDKPPYTNKNSLSVPGFLAVRQNGEILGTLKMATSKQIAFNNSPAGKSRGDIGYRVDLFYVKENTGLNYECSRQVNATDHAEITKEITISDIYDFQLKQGWNFIKVEVTDNQFVGNISYYKTKQYTTIPKLTDDVKWVFYKY